MKDIWAVPPGGPVEATPARRSQLKTVIAAGLVMSLGLGVGGVLRWMGASTPVSNQSVLAQFRAETAADRTDQSEARPTKEARKPARKHQGDNRREQERKGPQRRATEQVAQTRAQKAPVAPAKKSPGGESRRSEQAPREPGRPEEGVYTWAVDGYEKAPGTNRTLPEESHRVVTWQGDNRWTEHHVFSEQKETWLGLQFQPKGVSTTSVRNRVVMGPVTVDKTIVFNPPMFVGLAPFKLGQTWEGSWRGKTSGEYQARTFDHTTLVVGGEEVEVWATEVKMTMRGEVSGTATVRSWVAPEYNLVVKQYQDTRVTTGPGEYRSEWTGQVKSLHPQR